jgi:hypothetical protein
MCVKEEGIENIAVFALGEQEIYTSRMFAYVVSNISSLLSYRTRKKCAFVRLQAICTMQ